MKPDAVMMVCTFILHIHITVYFGIYIRSVVVLDSDGCGS
jgi:hypothetical protein